jgi:GAF domain-containing protein
MKLSIFNLHRSSTPETADQPDNAAQLPVTPPEGASPQVVNGSALIQDMAARPAAEPILEGQNVFGLDLWRPATPQNLRLRILNLLCITASILGVIIFLVNLPDATQASTSPGIAPSARLAFYSLACVGLLVITFVRRISYPLRASLLLIILFAVGAGALVADGLYGSGRIILIVLPFLAALLLGRLGRVSLLTLSIAALIITGVLMATGIIPAPLLQPGAGNSSLLSWSVAIAHFALLAITGILSFALLLTGLEDNLRYQKALLEDARKENAQLEDQIQERTNNLQHRLLQIRTAAEITRTISRMLDTDVLLPQICELVRERFGLYYVGVFLNEPTPREVPEAAARTDPNRPLLTWRGPKYAVLVAGTGEAGKRMLAEKHMLLIGGDSMIGWCIANRQARIALDVGKEPTRFNNPHLPRTRSELALPILGGTGQNPAEAPGDVQVLGAMTIQSDEESAFDQDDIIVLQSIADGLASAIENAQLFAATQNSLEEVKKLHRQYLERAWSQEMAAQGKLEYTVGETLPGETTRTLDVPLRLREQVIGHLTLELKPDGAPETQAQRTPAEELALVEAIAAQATLALENARLLEETRRKATQESLGANISSKVWASVDIDTILRAALQEVGGSLNVKEGWIQILPEETR